MVLLPQAFVAKEKDEDIVINQEEGSITFVVNRHLAPPKTRYYMQPADAAVVAEKWAEMFHVKDASKGLVATSLGDEKVTPWHSDMLYRTFVTSYSEHRPLVLSPDMIWLVIAQGFSHYVNTHSEQLRPYLVNHSDKMMLEVRSKEELLTGHPDWQEIINHLEQQISENSKGDIARTIVSDFSTTKPCERLASQITLMDCVKTYFNYEVGALSCGIPNITLLGTPEDWQKVHDKAMQLEKYGLKKWTSKLDPILQEFVSASQGRPNIKFWKGIVNKQRIKKLYKGNCGMGGESLLNGWFLHLFPYDKKGERNPKSVPYTKEMMCEMLRVPFKYILYAPDVTVIKEVPMELDAGFIGVKEDSTSRAIIPQIGWMVRVWN